MIVERCCQALLLEILKPFQNATSSYAIEIGCGTFDFYCNIFDQLGFNTVAVEPLPVKKLRQLCTERDILLVEACIAEYDGLIDLYIGSFLGEENLNLNSIRSNWWGATSNKKQVDSMTLESLLKKFNIQEISCLKIDIEGAEYSVLRQLSDLSRHLLPKVLMFEYGGGATFESKQGGWSDVFFQDTLNILELLRELSYQQVIKIDSEKNSSERLFNLQDSTSEVESIFDPQNIYGNIIATFDSTCTSDHIQDICKLYRHESPLKATSNIPEPFMRRITRKIRQIASK